MNTESLLIELSNLNVKDFTFDFKPYFSQKTCGVICHHNISNDSGGKVIRGYMSLIYDVRRNTIDECLLEIKKLAENSISLINNSESKS